ncbi:MAG: aldo/keto reductase family oxidoreductase [Alphaproteobacteria bacterium]
MKPVIKDIFYEYDLVWGNMRIFDEPLYHEPSNLAAFLEWLMEQDITLFDTADIYGGYTVEKHFGKALKLLKAERSSYKLITKCSIAKVCPERPENEVLHYNSTGQYIADSIEQSLENLQTDYIDLLLLHRPDYLMDAQDTAAALSLAVASGQIRHIGVSNFTPSQITLLQSFLDIPLVTNQVEFSPLHLEPLNDGTFDQAQQMSARPMIWSPFAGGRIFNENNPKLNQVLDKIAKQYNISKEAVILAWIMRLPSRPLPIIGSNKKENILKAIEANKIKMDIQEWYQILQAAQGHPIP